MKKIKFAAVLILIHGIIEIMGPIGAIMAGTSGSVDINEYMHFIVPFFQDNFLLVNVSSFIYGLLRVVACIGLFKNRQWGLKLSQIISVVTLTLMMFVLPAGIMDGVLSGAVLVLLLIAEYGEKKIV